VIELHGFSDSRTMSNVSASNENNVVNEGGKLVSSNIVSLCRTLYQDSLLVLVIAHLTTSQT